VSTNELLGSFAELYEVRQKRGHSAFRGKKGDKKGDILLFVKKGKRGHSAFRLRRA